MSYHEAVDNCKGKFGANTRGTLFEPRNRTILDEVLTTSFTKLMNGSELNPHIWIGVVDKIGRGVFTYEMGGYLLFTNWNKDKPSTVTAGKPCVQAIHNIKGEWNVMNCTGFDVPSICEVHIDKSM